MSILDMEEVLRQILTEIKEIKVNQTKTDKKVDYLTERIEMNDRSNNEEFRKLDKKLDSITEKKMTVITRTKTSDIWI